MLVTPQDFPGGEPRRHWYSLKTSAGDIEWRSLWQIAVRLCTSIHLVDGDQHVHRGGRRRCCARQLARALTLL